MSDVQSVIKAVAEIVGNECVLTDQENLQLYSMDIWKRAEYQAAAVVRPSNTEELAKAVGTITSAGFAVAGRGGGMSYTSGYLPVEENTFIIDCLNMTRILEINTEDMYVRVEAGVSWKQLYEELKGSGYRTPFWGTLSGSKATVGGGISQNSIFWGGGQYGSAADSVMSMDVVIADGTVITTGSAAQKNGTPFFRHYGPDLTGVFCADNGALGIKATITLQLIPDAKEMRFLSFNFEDHEKMIGAMNEISRQGLAMECFGFDPTLTEIRAQRDSLINDAKAFVGVLTNSGGMFKALKDGIRIALAGRGFMKDLEWPCYVIIEERGAAAAKDAEQQALKIARSFGAQVVEPSIPKIVRANPFGPVNNIIGPGGERWVPVHGLFPLSKAAQAVTRVKEIYKKHQADIDKHGIYAGFLFNSISTHAFAVEPVFFWPDEIDDLHRVSVESSFYNKVKKNEANAESKAVVNTMREEISQLFCDMGAVHLQIGKSYHYSDGIRPEALNLIVGIKKQVDPKGRMNPGCLGL